MLGNRTRKVQRGGKTYETHDNGGRPFRVTVRGTKVSVVKTETPEKPLLDFTVKKTFVGKKSPTGGYDGLTPKEAEGNSLLFQVSGGKYVFIGHEIFSFSPVEGDTIQEFYSNIGHSDVPYPYAIGKTHIYLMLIQDKFAVEKSFFDMKKGIYEQYFFVNNELDMCLRGYGNASYCKDKKQAREQIKELEEKTKKLRTKLLQKRL